MGLGHLLKVFASLFDAEFVEYKRKEDEHDIMSVYQISFMNKKAYFANLRNGSFVIASEDNASNDLVKIKKWLIENEIVKK